MKPMYVLFKFDVEDDSSCGVCRHFYAEGFCALMGMVVKWVQESGHKNVVVEGVFNHEPEPDEIEAVEKGYRATGKVQLSFTL